MAAPRQWADITRKCPTMKRLVLACTPCGCWAHARLRPTTDRAAASPGDDTLRRPARLPASLRRCQGRHLATERRPRVELRPTTLPAAVGALLTNQYPGHRVGATLTTGREQGFVVVSQPGRRQRAGNYRLGLWYTVYNTLGAGPASGLDLSPRLRGGRPPQALVPTPFFPCH